MKVPFLDLKIHGEEKDILMSAVERVFDHGCLVMGPEIEDLEKKLAIYCSRKYAVAVGSGTDALFLGLKALDIGPGDEVITTSLSWIATANAIALTGAKPVFADINNDLNIDFKSVKKLISKNTKAILVVNFTGRICDMDELSNLARQHKIKLVEDGSQSFGATYKERKCGSFGDLSGISHNPMKIFGACGESGSITCDSKEIYERLISLRYNGTVNRETCIEPSLNGRMDTLQASILLERLKTFENIISRRKANADFYNKSLSKYVQIPESSTDRSDVYYTYTIKTESRDQLRDYLNSQGIETKIQHPELMSNQPAYKSSLSSTPEADQLIKKILCIPVHEKLTKKELDYVVKCFQSFFTQQ
jgi:dTDP-4-amino-4,6-dideoxygalactose transaminase|tara:strand:- start:895 stop:1983 length:1089 start_codon:yes stop_codon:yes gene_type:complete